MTKKFRTLSLHEALQAPKSLANADVLPLRELANAAGVKETTLRSWGVGPGRESHVPFRVESYARVIALAKKHGIKLPVEYPHALEAGRRKLAERA
ncbi:MAG: hypothetical protein AABW54_00145 [Candidatus Micrarchaeota archaeon]